MVKLWVIIDQWELRVKIGVMEDPMDGNEDDNLDQGWEIEREKNKTKID